MTNTRPVSSLDATPSALLTAALAAAGLDSAACAAALEKLRASEHFGLPLFCPDERSVAQSFADRAKAFTDGFTSSFNPKLFNLSLTDLRDAAASRADRYAELGRAFGPAAALAVAGLEYAAVIPGDSVESRFARIIDSTFWTRHYLRQGKRAHEFAYIRSGFVSGARELYVSDSTLNLYRTYQKAQAEYMASHFVVDRRPNHKGELTRRPLADLAKSSEAKRAKLWAFLSGIEQLSVEAGLSCALLTLTLPASFHANPTSGGDDFDGVSTPRDGAQHLAALWNKIQRDLANKGIALSGARFVEPHKDGTPHWHLWIHYQESQLPTILAVIARYFPGDASKRVAAVRVRTVEADPFGKLYNKRDGSRFTEYFHRFDPATGALVDVGSRFKAQADLSVINRAYANGATYASKYAMKTLTPGDTSERVAAARWIWGMRGFQLFGVNRCLGAWDELFRAKEAPTDPAVKALFDAVHEKPGKHIRQVVNRVTREVEELEVEGGTAAFIRLQGGLAAARGATASDCLRFRLRYNDVANRYGDTARTKVGFMVLREDEWLYSATTREPCRFVLLSGRNIEAAIACLAPLDPEILA